ncbi:uncharacterized protein LOC131589800 [Poecile atricapillus]|uniref:uncharacterized protein LOC131589800 n=1 Tax=Poecile atricapillus TaxID=48891 RepID=UPI00273A4E3A|nr:uncharacterized protein LOC131589800 [Poecile atricapillus]
MTSSINDPLMNDPGVPHPLPPPSATRTARKGETGPAHPGVHLEHPKNPSRAQVRAQVSPGRSGGHTWPQVNLRGLPVLHPLSVTSQLRCDHTRTSPGAQVLQFGVLTWSSGVAVWGPHLAQVFQSRCCSLGSTPGSGSLTWSSGVAFWGPHLELRCCSPGVAVWGSHLAQVLSPGAQVLQFGVHTWSSGAAVQVLQFGFHTWSSGVAVQVLQFGVHTWSSGAAVQGPHLAQVLSPGAQVLQFRVHTWPRCYSLGFTPGAQVLQFGVHTWLRCCSPGVAVWGSYLAQVFSPGAQVLQFGVHTWPRCCSLGSTPGTGAPTCPGAEAFWGPHLSWLASTESFHLGLRCHSSGVAAADFWGPQVILGCSTPVLAHRYRILHLKLHPPGAPGAPGVPAAGAAEFWGP